MLRLLTVQVPGLSLVSAKDCAEQLLAQLTADPNAKLRSKEAETRVQLLPQIRWWVQSVSRLLWPSLRSHRVLLSQEEPESTHSLGGSSGQLRHSALGSVSQWDWKLHSEFESEPAQLLVLHMQLTGPYS